MRRPANNPFRVSRIESLRFRADDSNATSVMDRLASRANFGAIVGPHGSGKTTLLLELAERYRAAGFETCEFRLTDERPRLEASDWRSIESPSANERIVLLDSAGWLGFRDRRRLRRSAAGLSGLVVTAHRRTFLPTVIDTTPSEARLRKLLEELVGTDAPAWWPHAKAAYARYSGDVREVWRDLYDRWLTRPTVEAKA